MRQLQNTRAARDFIRIVVRICRLVYLFIIYHKPPNLRSPKNSRDVRDEASSEIKQDEGR